MPDLPNTTLGEQPVYEQSSTTATLSTGEKAKKSSWRAVAHHRIIANGKYAPLALYILSHLLIFAVSLIYHLIYSVADKPVGAVDVAHVVSKASGLMLHLDVAVILFPICHNVVHLLRQTFLARILHPDSRIFVHKLVGWSIVFFAWVHIAMQWTLSVWLARNEKRGIKGFAINNFATGIGWTGHIMLLLLMLIAMTSFDIARKDNFLRAWAVHQLFIPFYALWCVHEVFVFQRTGMSPWTSNGSFWQYWIFGGLAYLVETIMTEVRGSKKLFVSKVIQHPSQIIEIQIEKHNAMPRVGHVSLYDLYIFELY